MRQDDRRGQASIGSIGGRRDRFEGGGQAKVSDLDVWPRHEDVRRLEVPVYDAQIVDVHECIQDLA